MKKLSFYGMIIILLFSLVNVSEGNSRIEEDPIHQEANALIKAFETSETDLMEINVNSTLQLPNKILTLEEMENIKENLIRGLGLEGERKLTENKEHYDPYFMVGEAIEEKVIYINRYRDEATNQITVSSIDPSGEMAVLKLYSAEVDNKKESHIIVDIVKNKGYKDIGDNIRQQQELLTKYGDRIETTTTLVGTTAGRFTEKGTKAWVESVIKSVKGKKIEEVMDDDYTSTTLYTKEISKVMKYDNKKINVQIATRYSAFEDKTYMWIATPLITNTY
ncbi:YwmB family TATA-box binding protein [Alkaliphilus hydrothermalis]|uniref:TATA-box binding n=1 Tax=Alkaliphilus hydrothermalis TaxID=1482730 RepID=A0ABS2NQA1_9FIRM|nr:YwmB family TATA-box binding protein [Alkaliphilus hydrothermalis]MBM7615134.1 hypothetical protein [Alkaliphilus hydrothermalis]